MGLGGFFKNLFGSAKEKVSEVADKAEDFAEEAIEKVKETAAPLVAVSYTHLDVYKRQI